jgi:Fe2+ transport system protein FeoA
MVETGRRVRIQRIFGGHGLQRRLSAMGLAAGMEIDMVRNDRGGPLVIKVLDSRFMIGRGMAHHIMVS